MKADIRRVDSCTSTSTLLAGLSDADHGSIVVTDCQTAGRGQRGNSWEAEPGSNLTFSMLLKPTGIDASRQFELSMLVALAVADIVEEELDSVEGHPEVAVKWPNDIYVGNNKISGILIENTLCGFTIERSIAGIGLNVNQLRFISNAPNPVSLISYTGRTTALEPLLERLATKILKYVDNYDGNSEPLLERYHSRLWRRDGEHTFALPDGTQFNASITGVASDGFLTLSNEHSYAFKEVAFVL